MSHFNAKFGPCLLPHGHIGRFTLSCRAKVQIHFFLHKRKCSIYVRLGRGTGDALKLPSFARVIMRLLGYDADPYFICTNPNGRFMSVWVEALEMP
jgi:hypothetical protein